MIDGEESAPDKVSRLISRDARTGVRRFPRLITVWIKPGPDSVPMKLSAADNQDVEARGDAAQLLLGGSMVPQRSVGL